MQDQNIASPESQPTVTQQPSVTPTLNEVQVEKKKSYGVLIILIIIIVLILGAVGFFILFGGDTDDSTDTSLEPTPTNAPVETTVTIEVTTIDEEPTETDSPTSETSATKSFVADKLGYSFEIPIDWEGMLMLNEEYEGGIIYEIRDENNQLRFKFQNYDGGIVDHLCSEGTQTMQEITVSSEKKNIVICDEDGSKTSHLFTQSLIGFTSEEFDADEIEVIKTVKKT